MIGDYHIYGFDAAQAGGDKSIMTIARRPGWLRKLFRRVGIDRSTWEYKIIEQREV